MAALFRTDEKSIAKLFQNSKTVIKQGLTQQQVVKYKQVIEKTGAFCRIVKERPQHRADMKPLVASQPKKVSTLSVHPEKPAKKVTPKPESKTQVCPKRGFKQDGERVDCMRCGIVFARFNSQAEDDETERSSGRKMR